MTALEIAAALIILLVTILILLKMQKKCSCKCSSKETPLNEAPKVSEPTKQQQEPAKPINNSVASAKPQVKAAASAPPESNCSHLPQDSILRRHYLTHLCTMIESLSLPQPTDSVLCRHYNMMIIAKIDQCLNNKKAMEQLICDYEKNQHRT